MIFWNADRSYTISTDVCRYDRYFSYSNGRFLDDDSYLNLDIEGNVPNAINEIIVTDYLCNEGNLKIGDEVRFYGNPFIISELSKLILRRC